MADDVGEGDANGDDEDGSSSVEADDAEPDKVPFEDDSDVDMMISGMDDSPVSMELGDDDDNDDDSDEDEDEEEGSEGGGKSDDAVGTSLASAAWMACAFSLFATAEL